MRSKPRLFKPRLNETSVTGLNPATNQVTERRRDLRDTRTMKHRLRPSLHTLPHVVLPALALALLLAIVGSKWWRELSWSNTTVTEAARRREGRTLCIAEGSVVCLRGRMEWDEVGWSRWGSKMKDPPTVQLMQPGGLYGFLNIAPHRALWFEHDQQRSSGPGLAYQQSSLRLPLWPLFALCAAPTALRLSRWCRARRFAERGGCRGCGYDLRHTPDRCPECGRTVASSAGEPVASFHTRVDRYARRLAGVQRKLCRRAARGS